MCRTVVEKEKRINNGEITAGKWPLLEQLLERKYQYSNVQVYHQ